MRLALEALEDRSLLTVAFNLNGTVLSLIGAPNGPHNVLVRAAVNPTTTAATVDVVADGVTRSFAGLTQVNYNNLDQQTSTVDTFTNRVATLPGTILAFNSHNDIYTIAPKSTVLVGNGNNNLQVTGGNSIETVGNGFNTVYGGPGDAISVGSNVNTVYDILPGTQTITVAPHTGVDHLFVGPQSTLIGAQAQDHVATFFVAAPLGSGTFAQQGGTLYFAANNNGDNVTFFPIGPGSVFVLYNLNNGAGYQTGVFVGVNQIAAFGGTGADVFINNTSIDDVQYGAGGSNILVGGFGQLDLEKAGGQAATNSIAIGRSPVSNDLNGSGLTTTTTTLIFLAGNHNIIRTNSPTDVILGRQANDRVLSLYPDQIVAAFLPPFVPA